MTQKHFVKKAEFIKAKLELDGSKFADIASLKTSNEIFAIYIPNNQALFALWIWYRNIITYLLMRKN